MSGVKCSLFHHVCIEFWWAIEKRIPHSERDRFDRIAAFVYTHRKNAERRAGRLG